MTALIFSYPDMWETFSTWLHKYESIAIWLEGIALVLIFVWDRRDSRQQHRETLAQMEIMRNQARATETAADAATKSAEALINSERAWVMAELVPICVKFGDWWHRPAGSSWAPLSQEEVLKGDHLKYKLKFTNMGRTPAHILSFQIGYSCLLEDVTDLPEGTSGDLVEAHAFDHLLAASASTEVLEPIIDVNWYINSSDSIEVIKAIKDLKRTAVFHGWVRYQHVFSNTDVIEEPFCYSYSPQNMRLNKVVRPKTEQTNES